jgi:hypothetical protein
LFIEPEKGKLVVKQYMHDTLDDHIEILKLEKKHDSAIKEKENKNKELDKKKQVIIEKNKSRNAERKRIQEEKHKRQKALALREKELEKHREEMQKISDEIEPEEYSEPTIENPIDISDMIALFTNTIEAEQDVAQIGEDKKKHELITSSAQNTAQNEIVKLEQSIKEHENQAKHCSVKINQRKDAISQKFDNIYNQNPNLFQKKRKTNPFVPTHNQEIKGLLEFRARGLALKLANQAPTLTAAP